MSRRLPRERRKLSRSASLVAAQPGEPADRELALERRPAGAAAQPGDRELARADGTGGDDVVCHASLDCVVNYRIVVAADHFVNIGYYFVVSWRLIVRVGKRIDLDAERWARPVHRPASGLPCAPTSEGP